MSRDISKMYVYMGVQKQKLGESILLSQALDTSLLSMKKYENLYS